MNTYLKLKPNDRCWCGSDKKFKKCHQHRESQPLKTPYELLEAYKHHTSRKGCLHPRAGDGECKGKIVNAHTIQRNGGLTKISRDGHVYMLDIPLIPDSPAKRARAKLVGLKNATTFTGFCSRHDNMLFSALEDDEFRFSDRQCFLLAYRAVCKELYNKASAVGFARYIEDADTGCDLPTQLAHRAYMKAAIPASNTALGEMLRDKKKFDQMLLADTTDNLDFYAFELDRCPDFLCSTYTSPGRDFDGRSLQDVSDLSIPMHGVSLSIIPTKNGGAVVFSWLSNTHVGRGLIESLRSISVDEQPDAIRQLTFQVAENICISPDWWESLSDGEREIVIKEYYETTPGMNDLSGERISVCSWKIQRVHTNVNF